MLWQSFFKHFHPHISYRTFNPADYAEPASTDENYGNSNNNTWNNTGSFEPDDGTSESLHVCVLVCVESMSGSCIHPVAVRKF